MRPTTEKFDRPGCPGRPAIERLIGEVTPRDARPIAQPSNGEHGSSLGLAGGSRKVAAPREVGAQTLSSDSRDCFDSDRVARGDIPDSSPVGHGLLRESELSAQSITPSGLLEHFVNDGFGHATEYDWFVPLQSSSVVLQILHKAALAYASSMSFGARLASLRKAKNMTQQELGKGLGTDGSDAGKQVVYGWEKDQHYPRVDQLMLICKKLGVSADFLLFGEASSTRYLAAEAAAEQLSNEERAALLQRLMEKTSDLEMSDAENQKAYDRSQTTPPAAKGVSGRKRA